MDARTSRYHEVYARWQRDPQGFWGEAAHDDRLDRAAQDRCSIPNAGVYGRWFADGVCNTCWNAVDRHVHARPRRAGRRSSTTPRSPARSSTITYAGC